MKFHPYPVIQAHSSQPLIFTMDEMKIALQTYIHSLDRDDISSALYQSPTRPTAFHELPPIQVRSTGVHRIDPPITRVHFSSTGSFPSLLLFLTKNVFIVEQKVLV